MHTHTLTVLYLSCELQQGALEVNIFLNGLSKMPHESNPFFALIQFAVTSHLFCHWSIFLQSYFVYPELSNHTEEFPLLLYI